jgi:hypothetical protein
MRRVGKTNLYEKIDFFKEYISPQCPLENPLGSISSTLNHQFLQVQIPKAQKGSQTVNLFYALRI